MTMIGGLRIFWGPILGTLLFTLLQSWVSLVSNAWQIYVGALFIVVVMYAPGGIAALILAHGPLWRAGRIRSLVLPYARLVPPIAIAIGGFVALVELCSFVTIGESGGKTLHLFGRALDPATPLPWVVATTILLGGLVLAYGQARAFAARWAAIAEELGLR
jgi:branched-chain amino acid transport system permease protein